MSHQAGRGRDGADGVEADDIARDSGISGAGGDDETADAAEGAEPAEPAEPARPKTGEPRVDAALTLLDRLTELPVTEHAAVFEHVHTELTAVLGQLDPESAGPDG